MSIYDVNGNVIASGEPSTIIIAASDSSDENKGIADYVCDGSHDEVELQNAIDAFGTESGQIILCNGHYYIDSFTTQGTYGKFGLCIKNPTVNHDIIIRGISHPNRVYLNMASPETVIGIGATINVTASAYASIGTDDTVTVLGAIGPKTQSSLNITLENVGFNVPGSSKKMTVVDLQYFGNARINYCHMGLSAGVSPSTTPHASYIGIRGLPGWNFGAGYYIRNCFLYGFGVAFDLGGEHLIMEDCGCRFCDITYRFNGYDNPAKMSHPQTLINCCEEECIRSMYFCTSSTKQTVTLIDFNIEARPTEYPNFPRSTKAVEQTPGNYRGTITYSANYENYINTSAIPFWESGSGLNFETRNTTDLLYGSTSNRPSNPNIRQQYFDTTLGKMIVYLNGWKDMNGASV